jgi:hypothetical protein
MPGKRGGLTSGKRGEFDSRRELDPDTLGEGRGRPGRRPRRRPGNNPNEWTPPEGEPDLLHQLADYPGSGVVEQILTTLAGLPADIGNFADAAFSGELGTPVDIGESMLYGAAEQWSDPLRFAREDPGGLLLSILGAYGLAGEVGSLASLPLGQLGRIGLSDLADNFRRPGQAVYGEGSWDDISNPNWAPGQTDDLAGFETPAFGPDDMPYFPPEEFSPELMKVIRQLFGGA